MVWDNTNVCGREIGMKKWTSVLVAVAFAFVMLGCAGDEEASGTAPADAGTQVEEAAETSEESAAETTEGAVGERRERTPGARGEKKDE